MFHSHPTFSDSVNVPQSLVLRTLCAVPLLSSHHGSSLFLVCTQKPLAICYVLFINNAPIQPSVHLRCLPDIKTVNTDREFINFDNSGKVKAIA